MATNNSLLDKLEQGSKKQLGHNSSNGVVPAIEVKSGKIVDYDVMTSKCKECHHWSKKDKNICGV